MNKAFFFSLFFIIIPAIPLPSSPRGILPAFSGLEAQLDANLEEGMNRAAIISRLEEYLNPGDPEMAKGMEMILAGDSGRASEPNYALRLLIHMLNERSYAPGDTMVMAMALVNNNLYAGVNDEIRREIKKDLVRHWNLYRKIVAWQKKLEIRIDLSRMPLVPKMYWADRRVYPPEGITYAVRTLDDYREYVDTMETLEYFHDLADRHRVYEGASVGEIADNVRTFINRKDKNGFDRDFYGPTPEQVRPFIDRIPHDAGYDTVNDKNQIMYKGAWRNINGFIYINYQRKLFQSLGRFIGLCEVFSLSQMAMFKGMGIPSGLMIRNSPKEVYAGHVFASCYDPFRRRWNNLEIIKSSNKAVEIGLVIGKPVWHHRVRDLKELAEEKETAPRFFRLLDLGIQEKHFNAIFFSNKKQFSNTIFSREALPDDLTDTDGDTIYDFEERLLGLDPLHADTARDGVSDLWKLTHGLDPKTPVTDQEAPPVDGLGGGYSDAGKLQSAQYEAYSGKNEHDEIQEVRTLSAARFSDMIYVSVSFYNDISKNRKRTHHLAFSLLGGSGNYDSFEVLIDSDNPRPANAAIKEKSKDGFREIRGWAIRDVELAIPARYLNGAEAVKIRYRAFVRKEGRNVEYRQHELVLLLQGDNPLAKYRPAFITNRGAGKALSTGSGAEDNQPVYLSGQRMQNEYRWRLVPSGGHVLIVSDYNWKCLEARDDGSVVQGRIERADAKEWRIERGADGLCRIISRKTGAPLAVIAGKDGKPALALSAGADQYWEIQLLDSALEAADRERTVGIISVRSNMAVDLYSGKTEDGAAIKLWPRTGNANQQWKMVPSGENGFVYIVAVKSLKCLSVKEENGALATVQATVTGHGAQKWKIVPRGSGGHMLINKEFNRALQTDAANPSSRALLLGEISESPAQLWKLEYQSGRVP